MAQPRTADSLGRYRFCWGDRQTARCAVVLADCRHAFWRRCKRASAEHEGREHFVSQPADARGQSVAAVLVFSWRFFGLLAH